MNKKIFVSLISLLIIGVIGLKTDGFGLTKSPTAFAVGDLTVDWGIGIGDVGAIFNLTNMAPSDSVTKTVHLTNSATSGRPIAVRGILTATDSANLANVMDIVISRGGSDIYGGTTGNKTLANFFADSNDPSGIDLFLLGANSSSDINIKVTFQPSAGNQYQDKSLSFDIKIGIGFDLPTACQNIQFSGDPIFGTSGNDNLKGGNSNKIIVSFDGNDIISGGNGRDCIIAGNGNNKITGGNGNDIIMSGNGKNDIDGGNGDDVIIVGNGGNKIDGGNGDDTVTSGSGNDNIQAGNGDDAVDAGAGNDQVSGGNGKDQLIGGDDIDNIDGGNGVDTCTAETKNHCEL